MDCGCATASSCVDGHCPLALDEEYPWFDSDVTSCDDCPYRAKTCMECILYPEHCPYKEK